MKSQKLTLIEAIVLDVDGVLTDGRIGYTGESGDEIKFFDVRDGHGLKLAMRAGLRVGILSGRKSKANRVRAKELGLSFIYEACHDKGEGFETLCREQAIAPEHVMYIGDDVVDIPPMRKCGFAVSVADGVAELDAVCDYRTKSRGGRGAVREAVELLLKGKGLWDTLMTRYFS